MMPEKRKGTAPSTEGCLYFSASGQRISREEFTTATPVDHLARLAQWMRESEAA